MLDKADVSVFPDEIYKRTVLAPLFNGAKTHYVNPVRFINQAHLVMLVDTGIISEQQGTAIASALTDIDQNVAVSELAYTGEHEDYFFLVEAELKARVGEDIAGMLHTGRSRNDMDHTVFKIVLRSRTDIWLEQALHLANAILEKAMLERETLIVAYTHGQPAQPTTFGHYLSAVLEVLLRDIERVFSSRELLDCCPMGAAAITTTGFPVNREQVAQLLGFSQPQLNSYGCIASVDYVTGLYSALKLPMLHLGRLTQDLQFWSAFEVGQLYVPNSLVQISSIMPQKRNPVPIEHLRHLASLSAGRCDVIINTMHNTPFTDMNDSEGEVQQAGYAAFESSGRVLDLLARLLSCCRINEDRVETTTHAACITITELADTLVRRESISFRQAHEIAANTSRAVIDRHVPLSEGYNSFRTAFKQNLQRETALSLVQFQEVVSARYFVTQRDRPGGPSQAALTAAFDTYKAAVTHNQRQLEDTKRRQKVAASALEDAFNSLKER